LEIEPRWGVREKREGEKGLYNSLVRKKSEGKKRGGKERTLPFLGEPEGEQKKGSNRSAKKAYSSKEKGGKGGNPKIAYKKKFPLKKKKKCLMRE